MSAACVALREKTPETTLSALSGIRTLEEPPALEEA
jgi:hypothetical protein